MFVVGLTGGIGSGKSTFAALLAERGGQIIDADEIGRDALNPGEPSWDAVVETFGSSILSEGSMKVDRSLLADIVFNDDEKLAALNQIVHPVIFDKVADHLESLRNTDAIVVLDAALILEMGFDRSCDVVLVVTAPEQQRTDRLHHDRHMTSSDIQARMGAQMSAEERIERADIVVDNSGTLDDLASEAERVWNDLVERSTQ
jgi:dephospho-CoA kinase